MQELVGRRDWNRVAFKGAGKQVHTEYHSGWMNYLEKDGNWHGIDCILREEGDVFVVDKAPFIFRAPKTAKGRAYFEANVRYDIFIKELITDDPLGMYLSVPFAEDVPGELFDINGDGRMDAVIYRQAFPQWDADLIYYVKHGRAPRLEKLVRFNSYRNVGDIDIPFDIEYTQDIVIRVQPDELSTEDKKREAKHVASAKRHFKKDTKEGFKKGMAAMLDAQEAVRKVWSGGNAMRTKNSIQHKPKGAVSPRRGIGMKDFYQWDSGDGGEFIKEQIEVTYQIDGPRRYRLIKHITDDFLRRGVYPCWTDTVTTVYPDPHTETTTVDGQLISANVAAWATARDATSGTANDSGTTIQVYGEYDSGMPGTEYKIGRGVFLLDLTAQEDDDVVDAATFSFTSSSVLDPDTTGVELCSSSPASNTSLTANDYNKANFGTTSFGSILNSAITADSATYNDITLNASGEAAVSFAAITKFALRDSLDFDNTTPTGRNVTNILSADTSGTSKDPKLVVTHTPAPPADPTNEAAAADDGTYDITITWTDNADDETSYRVERSDDGATGWAEIGSTAANVETYTDTVGTASTIKYYRVRAYSSTSTKYSNYTSVVNATTASATPSGLAVANVNGSTSLVLTWTDNSSDESTFRIERSNDGATGWAEVGNVSAGVVTYTDAVGANDTRRYYRVRALRAGDSVYSAYTSVANNITAPAAPSALAVSSGQGQQQLRLTWTDNSSSETTFSIERRAQGGASYSEITTDTASPYDDTGLSNETKYYYRIRAYNATDTVYSSYSSEVGALTKAAAPTNLRCLPTSHVTGAVKIMLLWDTDAVRATGFLVERSIDDAAWSTVTTTSAGALQYEDSGLTAGTTYYYRVSTVNANGTSSPTASVSVVADINTVAGMEFSANKKLGLFPSQ